MSSKAKNGQSKTRTVHIAVPIPLLKKIRKLADEDNRSINYKIKTLLHEVVAVHENRKAMGEQ